MLGYSALGALAVVTLIATYYEWRFWKVIKDSSRYQIIDESGKSVGKHDEWSHVVTWATTWEEERDETFVIWDNVEMNYFDLKGNELEEVDFGRQFR